MEEPLAKRPVITCHCSRPDIADSGCFFGRLLRVACALLFVWVVFCPVHAAVAHDPDVQIDAFVNAEGFTTIDSSYFWSEEWNGPHRFPRYDRERWILHADSGLSDAEKAILAIDALEGALTHVRYKITSTNVPNGEDWQPPFRFVEITRFNLGPTLFESIKLAYEGVFTPSDAEIERDPHITLRIVFTSNKFMGADPLVISRRELTDAEALPHACFALSCFDLADPLGDEWAWNEIAFDEGEYPSEYEDVDANGLTVPARIADLLEMAGEVRGDYEMVISSMVAGQDDIANGIIRYNRFVADDVSSDWIVRREVGGNSPSWGQLRTARVAGDRVWNLPYGFDTGQVEATHVPTEGLEAWRATLEFYTQGENMPVRYQSVFNREVATYISDHWMYLAITSFPGFVYARDPVAGTSLPLLERPGYPTFRIGEARLADTISPTGRTVQFQGHRAQEYQLLVNMPDAYSSVYLTWSGTFWAVGDLPAAAGWYGVPGSPFAGRSWQFSSFWQRLGWDTGDLGLIVQAQITLHEGLIARELGPVIEGIADVETLLEAGRGHQTVSMRLTELVSDQTGTLPFIFPDLIAIGSNRWPYDLPPQTVGILERF